MGMRSTIEIVTAATTVPIVVQPSMTPQVPTATIAAWARVGSSRSTLHSHESSFALRISKDFSRAEISEKRSAAQGERPKDLRMRMP